MPKKNDETPAPLFDVATETTRVPTILRLDDFRPPIPRAGKPCLVIIDGPDRGRTFALHGGKTRIGRHPPRLGQASAIVLQDSQVSRRHAIVHVAATRVVEVEDLQSTNGTFVGLERVEGRAAVKPSEAVTFGRTTAILVMGEEAAGALAEQVRREPK